MSIPNVVYSGVKLIKPGRLIGGRKAFDTGSISSTASHPEFSQYPYEEWYSIPLNTIQLLYELISRRIQVVLHAKRDPTP
ncbi:hypothetical protein TNCV_163061 [Trichonephila clavipes]|nr:hypothetical protein TNCV_163061 [Trichonephila clavipes]